jgi:hypothetical protein
MNSRGKRKRGVHRRVGRVTRMRDDFRTGSVISRGLWRVSRGRLPWHAARR